MWVIKFTLRKQKKTMIMNTELTLLLKGTHANYRFSKLFAGLQDDEMALSIYYVDPKTKTKQHKYKRIKGELLVGKLYRKDEDDGEWYSRFPSVQFFEHPIAQHLVRCNFDVEKWDLTKVSLDAFGKGFRHYLSVFWNQVFPHHLIVPEDISVLCREDCTTKASEHIIVSKPYYL
jgi:hypothetical protein